MYPPSPYANAVGSFRYPVDRPTVSPNEAPLVQVCYNPAWTPYIAGSLKQLLLQATWRDTDDTQLEEVQGRVFDLISMFGTAPDGCGVVTPGALCLSGTFADSPYGYANKTGVPDISVWVASTGWTSAHLSGPDQDFLSIGRKFTSATFVRSVEFDAHSTPTPRPGHMTVTLRLGGVDVFTHTFTQVLGTVLTVSESPNVEADEIYVEAQFDDVTTQDIILDSWSLCYTGDFPLSVAPDIWEVAVDFTTGDHGWAAIIGSGSVPRARYSAGVGWIECGVDLGFPDSELQITKTLSTSPHFVSIQAFLDCSGSLEFSFFFNFAYQNGTIPAGSSSLLDLVDLIQSNMRVDLATARDSTTTITLSKLVFRGLGVAPTDLT